MWRRLCVFLLYKPLHAHLPISQQLALATFFCYLTWMGGAAMQAMLWFPGKWSSLAVVLAMLIVTCAFATIWCAYRREFLRYDMELVVLWVRAMRQIKLRLDELERTQDPQADAAALNQIRSDLDIALRRGPLRVEEAIAGAVQRSGFVPTGVPS